MVKDAASPTRSRDRWTALFLALLSAALVLPRLDANRLWQDEAHTAVLARNVLLSGLPVASDGRNEVTIFADRRDLRDGRVYIWEPWFPIYLAAGSMALGGAHAFAARLPFACAFILLVGLGYLVFRRWNWDRETALTAAILMLGSIPLLLHARQSRYYLLVPLLNLLIVDAYREVLRKPRAISVLALILWASLLIETFFPAAALLAIALGIDLARDPAHRARFRTFAWAALAVLVINFPMAWYERIWDRKFGVQPGYTGWEVFARYLLRYLLTLEVYFFPLVLFALMWVPRVVRISHRAGPRGDMVFLSVLVCLTQLVGFALLSEYPFTRYLVGTAPFLLLLGAWCIRTLTGGRNVPSWLLVSAILGTNLLSVLPLWPFRLGQEGKPIPWSTAGIDSRFLERGRIGIDYARGETAALLRTRPGFPLLDYGRSLVDPPTGPLDAIVDYLGREASPSDRVKISYEDTSLMFHTPLAVTSRNGVGPPAPEWIIFRHFNRMKLDRDFMLETSRYRYELVELPVPDVQWNNQPDPLYHFYRTPPRDLAPPVRIFRRREPKVPSGEPAN